MAMRYFEQFVADRFGRIKNVRVQELIRKVGVLEAHFAERSVGIRGDADRSAEWKKREQGALLSRTIKGVTKDGSHELKRMRRELEASRPRVPRLDKADIVGALEDLEIRQWIRDMEPGARVSLVLAMETDPRIIAAVLRSSPQLLGVPAEVHQRAVERVLEASNGPKLKFIAETTDDIEIGQAAVDLVMADCGNLHREIHGQSARGFIDFVAAETAQLNAALAAEFKDPSPEMIDIEFMVNAVRTAPYRVQHDLIDRLLAQSVETFNREHGAAELDKLRGTLPAAAE